MPRILRRSTRRNFKRRRPAAKRRGAVRRFKRVFKRRFGAGRRRRYGRARIRGRGKYTVSYGGSSRGNVQTIPTFANTGEASLNLAHKEMIGKIVIKKGYSGNFQMATIIPNGGSEIDCAFRVVGGNRVLFPWGANIMQMFENYKLNGMHFTFETLVNPGSTTFTYAPEIIMCFVDNVFVNAPKTAEQMKIAAMQNSAKLNHNVSCGVECHGANINNHERFIVALNNQQQADELIAQWQTNINNRNETDHGQFFIGIQGGQPSQFADADQVVGNLWVTYNIRLQRPMFPEHRNSESVDSLASRNVGVAPVGTGASDGTNNVGQKPRSRDAKPLDIETYDTDGIASNNVFETHTRDNYQAVNATKTDGTAIVIPLDSEAHPYHDEVSENVLQFQDVNVNRWQPAQARYPLKNWELKNESDFCGHPRLYCRIRHAHSLRSDNTIATNAEPFKFGCLIPYAENVEIAHAQESNNIQLFQDYVDNIGVRWQRKTDGGTRLWFLRKIKVGTIIKITVKWNGVIRKSLGQEYSAPVVSNNNNNILWMAGSSIDTNPATLSGFSRIIDYDDDRILWTNQEIQLAASAALGGYVNNWRNAAKELRNDTALNFMNNTAPYSTLHPSYPWILMQDHYSRSFYFQSENDQTPGMMSYIELGPLTAQYAFAIAPTGWVNVNGGTTKFNNNVTNANTGFTALSCGSRSIVIEEVSTYEGNTYRTALDMEKALYSHDSINNYVDNRSLEKKWQQGAYGTGIPGT